MKLFISPRSSEITPDNGIGRVVHAQHKHLPALGVEIVGKPEDAEIIACHIDRRDMPRIDVLHCHGLHWTADGMGIYDRSHDATNREIIKAAQLAKTITVPSRWVAMPFQRDMHITPTVIGHGIDLDEWKPGAPAGYILWNKNRPTDVCDPTPAYELAKVGHTVVSTFKPPYRPPIDTFREIGGKPHNEMREFIRNASIYLATTQETFGIGTLEAMACGVPVLGYDWAGTADIVKHGINGYLVEPGDLDGLAAGVEYIEKHWAKLSKGARATAKNFTWKRVMQQYAEVYAWSIHDKRPSTVAVVITNYNYGRYLGRAIESALNQNVKPNEIIVVDDGSTDNSLDVIANYPVTLIKQQNRGVAHARNAGIQAATTDYIICLDADDLIKPEFIATLKPALDVDPSLGIAYTGLEISDGTKEYTTGWPPDFDYEIMLKVTNPPANCIPCCNMFRREMWVRSGGYRQGHAPAEDTEFWVRSLSLGWSARRVTPTPLFRYFIHPDSASRTKAYHAIDQYLPWMRDGILPMAAPVKRQPPIRSYIAPTISIIIPVGPGHETHVQAAIDSVEGQTFRNWELIIVNDSGKEIYKDAFPYARTITTKAAGGVGAGEARNIGIKAAKAPLVFFLDADDYLDPTALEKMLMKYTKSDGRYVYSDFMSVTGEGVAQHQTKEYNQGEWGWQHNIGVLMDTQDARRTMFDNELLNEDWGFWVKCAINGICGVRLAEPLYYYRMSTGKRRDNAFAGQNLDTTLAQLRERYAAYYEGKSKMSPCCGGNNSKSIMAAKRSLGLLPKEGAPMTDDVIRLEFIGQTTGSITYTVNGKPYKGGNNALHRYVDAPPADAERLISFGVWRVVRKPVAAVVPKPEPTPTPEPAPTPVEKKPRRKVKGNEPA